MASKKQTLIATLVEAGQGTHTTLQRSTLKALEAMVEALPAPVEETPAAEEKDLLGEVEETADEEAGAPETGDEAEEKAREFTILETGKHAGHAWKSTKSGGYCWTCDQVLVDMWKRVDEKLKGLGKGVKDLRAEAKARKVTLISLARLVDETGKL